MNRKILIVDDEKEYLQIAMNFIIEESIPYALLCAPNGKISIEIAEKELPDIIIMDWEMPEMNGIDAIKQLKKNELTKDIPVIMSTGLRLSPQDLKTAFDAGASDFMKKPLEKTEFIARVSSHLRMADYLKIIKKQANVIAETKINQLNNEIQSLHTKKDKDKALFYFFNEILKSFLEKLDSIDTSGKNTKSNIDIIINQVNQSIRSINNSCSGIENPTGNFIKLLIQKHNNLTPQEVQLCFMLKNKLSTKDIASITFREESSVKVSRSRLRKKLDLKESENLITYFDNF
jgi:DNA-binding response OmpR family regulator/DNA-binding CsgD family transcriptional regulator